MAAGSGSPEGEKTITDYLSAAETIAALEYDGKVPFQAAIFRICSAERGTAAARAYLDTEVAAGDRAEVLRMSRQAALITTIVPSTIKPRPPRRGFLLK